MLQEPKESTVLEDGIMDDQSYQCYHATWLIQMKPEAEGCALPCTEGLFLLCISVDHQCLEDVQRLETIDNVINAKGALLLSNPCGLELKR